MALAAHAQAIHATAIPLHRIIAPTLVLAGDADPAEDSSSRRARRGSGPVMLSPLSG